MTYPEREGTTTSEMQSSAQTYALGHTDEAFKRLLVQGQLFNPFTQRLFERLASEPECRCRRLWSQGCQLACCRVVGEQGSVIGVDANASVRTSRKLVRKQLAWQISFLAGNIDELALRNG
jgi:hypothetical protein